MIKDVNKELREVLPPKENESYQNSHKKINILKRRT